MSNERAYDIAHELIKVIKLLRRKTFDSSNSHNHINLSSHMILHLLKDQSKKTLSEISEQLGLPNSTASVLVEKLVKEGLVSRVRDSEDRRRVIICLTDKADKFVDEMRESHIISFGKLMKTATDDEIEEILNGFRILSDIIERDNETSQT